MTREMRATRAAAGQTVIDERKAPPAGVVIFGASGDLTTRKLGQQWRTWPGTSGYRRSSE
jgi:hypothetical protein